MANILEMLFGSKYPSTQKIEHQQQQLIADKNKFVQYSNSHVYQRYLELDDTVHSGEFEKRIDKIKNGKFQETEAYHQQKRYLELKKSNDIKTYLAFVREGKDKMVDEYRESAVYLEFEELQQIVNSPDFKHARSQKGFKKTDDYQQLKRFNKLKRKIEVKFVQKTLTSNDYQVFTNIKGSSRLEEYLKLDDYVNSSEYKNIKAYYDDKKRYYKSDEFKLLHEYGEIEKTDDFKWFQKTKAKNPFIELDKWQLTFMDDFDQKKLDESKWMTGYFWGKALLNDNYVLASEKQYFTDKNIELRDSSMRINTRNEKCVGKVWDAEKGFSTSNFDFTSGLINTGHSFRQQYGKFEVKLKMHTAPGINHAFWMLGEKISPQITVLKTGAKNQKAFYAGTISQSGNKTVNKTEKIKGLSFGSDYHIIGLEWSKNELVWKINGVEVHKQVNDIPDIPMYLIFSTHIDKAVDVKSIPSVFEIDWIKCYQLKK